MGACCDAFFDTPIAVLACLCAIRSATFSFSRALASSAAVSSGGDTADRHRSGCEGRGLAFGAVDRDTGGRFGVAGAGVDLVYLYPSS